MKAPASELRDSLYLADKEEAAAREKQDRLRAGLLRDAGLKLREWRIAQGLSAVAASRRCGMSVAEYMECEDGTSSNRTDYFAALDALMPRSNLEGAA